MIDFGLLAVTILGSVLSVFWLVLYFKGKDAYADIIDSISEDDYMMSDLFFVGFAFLNMINYRMDSNSARKKLREVSEIYGAKYAQYYLYILRGGQATYALTFVVMAVLLAALSGELLLLPVGIILSGLLVYYLEEVLNDKISDRREELILDFPNVLSKLTLLVNSGMVMREAWRKIAYTNDRQLYKEMQITIDEIDNGIEEIDAYMNFAERCYVKEIRKFASTMIQNMQKGSAELVAYLREMSDEMWEAKKYAVKKKGDAAASKLMIPTVLIFLGILILIMVPMLAGIGI